MPHHTMLHDTHTFERRFSAPVARLFAAWANPKERAVWGSPDPSVVLRYHAADFTLGGEDLCDCVAGGEVVATVRTRWLHIARDEKIVSAEAIASPEGPQGVSLISAEFQAEGAGSRLILTVQTVALDGSGLESGVVEGWGAAMEALAELLGEG